MRCLYCGKKLSLLKLAKGDSFCTPEHFDAYQLKLSKDAFERLIGSPSGEAVRAPLPVPPATPAAQPEEANRDVRQEPQRAAQLPPAPPPVPLPQASEAPNEPMAEQAMARLKAFDGPPAAPFARCQLASLPPAPESPRGEIAPGMEDEASPQQPAMPVLDVEATSCILNLYWTLNRIPSEPAEWTAARGPDVEPEQFAARASKPGSALAPEFPEYEQQMPDELAPRVETNRLIGAVRPSAAEPVSALFGPLGPAPAGRGDLHLPTGPQPIDTLPEAEVRLPFLMAPTFGQRRSNDPLPDCAASWAVPSLASSVTFRPMPFGPFPSPRGIPRSATMLARPPVAALDSRGKPISMETAFLVSARPCLPASREQDSLGGWHARAGVMQRSAAAVEFGLFRVPALDCVATRPESRLPGPDTISPAQALLSRLPVARAIEPRPGISRTSWPAPWPQGYELREVLAAPGLAAGPTVRRGSLPIPAQDRPAQGAEPLFGTFPARAMAGKFPPKPANSPGWERLAPTDWNCRATVAPVAAHPASGPPVPAPAPQPISGPPERRSGEPAGIAPRSVVRAERRQGIWPVVDSPVPVRRSKPTAVTVAPGLTAPAHTRIWREIGRGEIASVTRWREFVAAPGLVEAWPEALSWLAASLPASVADDPSAVVGLCPARLAWELKQVTSPDAPQPKFLPVRKGPVLPPVPVWSRLQAPPR